MKINDLEIDLNTEGWDKSEGRSNNVWGQVPTSNLPFKAIENAINENHKSCIWTCYDEEIYQKDKNGNLLPLNKEKLPKTISATVKFYFENRIAVVAENLGMRIAVALDMPTSYNYIVKFDKEKYPQVLRNFPSPSLEKKVLPYAVVSVDFLKAQHSPAREIDEDYKTAFSGDELILFERSIRHSKMFGTAQPGHYTDSIEFRYIENWIKSVDYYADKILTDATAEERQKTTEKINSRIVRSFLLREFVGDCDFTDKNGGLIINRDLKEVAFAPNFDYGQSFNALISKKFSYLRPKEELEEILKWQPDFLEKNNNILTETLAQQYAGDASERNLKYVIKNYPSEVKEFTNRLVKMIREEKFDDLVDSYTAKYDVETALLSNEEAKMFKIYLNTRAGWLQNKMEIFSQKQNTFDKNFSL